MGEGELEVDPSPSFLSQKYLTLAEKLDNDCAYYIAIGMPYQEYWEGDPEAVKYYRKAQEIRVKEENAKAWWQGAYFYEALVNVAPALMFGSKSKPKPYPNQPHEITLTADDKLTAEKKELIKQKSKFERMVEQLNSSLKKNQGGEDLSQNK